MTTNGSDNCDTGSKVILWDEERSGGTADRDQVENTYNRAITWIKPQQILDCANNAEIFRDETSPQSQHGSNSNNQTLETGNRDQLDDPTHLQMGVNDDYVGDETGCDLPSIYSQLTTLTVGSCGSSVIQTDSSSGYHSPMRSQPSDSSNFCRPGRSAGGQASGRGEAVSSFGQHGQEYNPSDVDSHHSIPSHCLMDPLGPPREESRKKPRKTSENRQSGTSSRRTDQVIYKRTDGGAGMERASPSGATQGHVRSSHGDREARATRKHPKQRKKLKKEPYPAEVDDNMKEKMEAIMPMFTERVDPGLLQLHLRGCLKDYQCEHIRNQSDVKPRPYVNQTLWNYLKRAPYWWQNLERALEECGYNKLLAKLKEE
ncbi:uncharacterized protein LOC124281936 [Haliotis rubra]|uniref:uncharacterized protein LOC124281936 n=1 Tax=Haliotis rubra TaxID=36100 RepID=UPI001EE5FEC3|nr:uncharacterized protein LOC124281936 [Haliotis rubra]